MLAAAPSASFLMTPGEIVLAAGLSVAALCWQLGWDRPGADETAAALPDAGARDEVCDGVKAAAENRTVLSPSVASRLFARVRTPAPAGVDYAELGVPDRAAAVAAAYQRGILTTPAPPG